MFCPETVYSSNLLDTQTIIYNDFRTFEHVPQSEKICVPLFDTAGSKETLN